MTRKKHGRRRIKEADLETRTPRDAEEIIGVPNFFRGFPCLPWPLFGAIYKPVLKPLATLGRKAI